MYSWIECPCHYRHTDVLSVSRIARTDLRPATSVSEVESAIVDRLGGKFDDHRVRVHKIGFTMLMEGSFGSDAFFEQLF